MIKITREWKIGPTTHWASIVERSDGRFEKVTGTGAEGRRRQHLARRIPVTFNKAYAWLKSRTPKGFAFVETKEGEANKA